LGIELNLNAIQPNITQDQVNNMAKKAMKDFCGISNPIQFNKRQLIHIYNNAIIGNFDHITVKG
jgi:alcohol dehydrogenase class IV